MSERVERADGEDASTYLHLTPADVWERQRGGAFYLPDAYTVDGFIHCTIGDAEMVAVGNRYYAGDPRTYVVLEIDPNRLRAPVRIEDEMGIYPHIYGPLDVAAVVAVLTVLRRPDGAFVAIERPR